MTLFNYGECDMCKLHQSRKRDVMLDVLPADICCKVGEYFGCWRCEDMKEREQKYSEKYINCIKTYTKPEIQLHFLRYYKKTFLPEASTWCDGGKEFQNEIDRIFDKPKVKEK